MSRMFRSAFGGARPSTTTNNNSNSASTTTTSTVRFAAESPRTFTGEAGDEGRAAAPATPSSGAAATATNGNPIDNAASTLKRSSVVDPKRYTEQQQKKDGDKEQEAEDAKKLARRPSLARRMSNTLMRRLSHGRRPSEAGGAIPDFDALPPREFAAWGRNDTGQVLHAPPPLPASQPDSDNNGDDSTNQERPFESTVVGLAVGEFHSLAASFTRGGSVWGCGENDEGQLDVELPPGTGGGEAAKRLPNHALEGKLILSIAVGAKHSAVVTSEGLVLTWGNNAWGQLGHSKDVPTKVQPHLIEGQLRKERAVRVACSESATFVLTEKGQVWSMGEAVRGALGRPGALEAGCSYVASPVRGALSCTPIAFVAAGAAHAVAITVTGRALGWGLNKHAQLGFKLGADKSNRFEASPVPLNVPECVWASCGMKHTIIIGADGLVYSAGAGDSGQLGRMSESDLAAAAGAAQSTPAQQGFEWGVVPGISNASRSACGSYHSIVLTKSGDVLGFGSNEFGEVCPASGSTPASSLKIFLPQPLVSEKTGAPFTLAVDVAAGGRGSAILRAQSPDGLAPLRDSVRLPRMHGIDGHLLAKLAREAVVSKSTASLRGAMAEFHATGLNGSYLTSKSVSMVDVGAVQESLAEVWRAMDLTKDGRKWCTERFEALHSELGTLASMATEPDQLRAFFIALVNPAIELVPSGTYVPLVKATALLNDASLKLLARWCVADCSAELFKARVLRQLLRVLDYSAASRDWFSSKSCAQASVRILTALYHAVQSAKGYDVSVGDFYAQQPSRWSQNETMDEWWRYLKMKRSVNAVVLTGKDFSLFDYPFLISAEAKRNVMKYDNEHAQVQNAVYTALSHAGNPFFELKIRREHLLDDAMASLLGSKNRDLAKPLKVEFIGEAGLDWGGVRKEFFEMLSGKLFDPKVQDFFHYPDADNNPTLLWFNARGKVAQAVKRVEQRRAQRITDKEAMSYVQLSGDCFNCPKRCEGGLKPAVATSDEFHCDVCGARLARDSNIFSCRTCNYDVCEKCREVDVPEETEAWRGVVMAGALMGLALYNATLLDVHFPAPFYSVLLGRAIQNPTLQDLANVDSTLAKGLQYMLDFPADDAEGFADAFGYQNFFLPDLNWELEPGGENTFVSVENRERYVRLRCQFELYAGIAPLLNALMLGFSRVVDVNSDAMKLFSPAEMELMIVGVPDLDFTAWQKVARYEGYREDTPLVKWFWEICREEFTTEQQHQLLQFATGASRAPIGGLINQGLIMQRAGPDSDQLPTAHTCFNVLLLPEYTSKDKLREKLKVAIVNNQGFGLQ